MLNLKNYLSVSNIAFLFACPVNDNNAVLITMLIKKYCPRVAKLTAFCIN